MRDDKPEVACWLCPNCGQMYFGDNPPDLCDFCGDFTTWRPVTFTHSADVPPKRRDDLSGPQQLSLFDD
jgi:rubredoxin